MHDLSKILLFLHFTIWYGNLFVHNLKKKKINEDTVKTCICICHTTLKGFQSRSAETRKGLKAAFLIIHNHKGVYISRINHKFIKLT